MISAFIHHPVKVAVGVLLLALFGVIALFRMPMQLTPEVEVPTITVETRWPGASPYEIEREIVQEQEEQLKSVEGLTKMTSECSDSVGTVRLEFLVGTDLEKALLMVNTRLQQVREYPEDADEPILRTSDANANAVAWFILSARNADNEEIVEFIREHNLREENPDLADGLDRVMSAHNPGLATMRMRTLAAEYPEVEPLLPADVNVPERLRFAEDQIEARFERVPGVSNSNVLGGREEELQVIVDPNKLAGRGLTIEDIRRVLREQNKDTSGGDVREGKRRYVVRTLGQYDSPGDVGDQILAMDGGQPVRVRDVAEVRLSYKKPDGFVRRYGTSNIAINVQRETGANVMDIMDGLRVVNADLNETILKDEGMMLTQVYDETDYINSAQGLVNQNIILGGALTIIVLMLFLHLGIRSLLLAPIILASALLAMFISPWIFVVTLAIILGVGFWYARGALVVALAIPISIVGTFLILNLLGRSLNVISLAGLAFAVGMLVDNAVVVLENIYRHYQLGDSPFVASEKATREVWGAVVASTITTLAVFLPVLLVQEEAGQLFRDIALSISAAVGLSLLVSVIVIPPAAARILKRREEGGRATAGHRAAGRFVAGVVGLNAMIQRGLIRKIAVVAGLMGGTVALLAVLWMFTGVEYLPTGNRNLIICLILPPPGYSVENLAVLGQHVEDELRPFWDVDPESEEAKKLPYPAISDFFYVARGRQVFLGLRSADSSRTAELMTLVADKFQRQNEAAEARWDEIHPEDEEDFYSPIPGAIVVAFQSSLFARGIEGSRTIDVEITGPQLEELVVIGGKVMAGKRSQTGEVVVPGAMQVVPDAQVRPVPSLDLSNPELHVKPKLVQMRELGVSSTDLGYSVDALIDGAYVTDYYIGGDKIDLVVMGSEEYAQRTQDLGGLPVATPAGMVVPVETLADVEWGHGAEQINHRERRRAITIQVTPPEGVPLQVAIDNLQAQTLTPLREQGDIPPEYTITVSGTADKLADTWDAMRWNFLFAGLITYLLMAALFESWTYPFVIILSVPLGAVGGLLGLKLLGLYLMAQGLPPQTLDVLTMLGFVILIGTVVNNAILIVHQSLNHMRDDAMHPQQAILESVRSRVRPIFMTTATTVFGLAPLVFFPGAGSELYRGLGAVVLGGLLVSTLFTLVLVPTLFSLMMDVVESVKRLLGMTTHYDEASAPQVAKEKRHSAGSAPVPAHSAAPPAEPAPGARGRLAFDDGRDQSSGEGQSSGDGSDEGNGDEYHPSEPGHRTKPR